jgi:hypothetical protein
VLSWTAEVTGQLLGLLSLHGLLHYASTLLCLQQPAQALLHALLPFQVLLCVPGSAQALMCAERHATFCYLLRFPVALGGCAGGGSAWPAAAACGPSSFASCSRTARAEDSRQLRPALMVLHTAPYRLLLFVTGVYMMILKKAQHVIVCLTDEQTPASEHIQQWMQTVL